jgi:hypothetical protein
VATCILFYTLKCGEFGSFPLFKNPLYKVKRFSGLKRILGSKYMKKICHRNKTVGPTQAQKERREKKKREPQRS